MAKLLGILALVAVSAAAQTVEGSVFDAATGTGVAGIKVELLKGATPFYETATGGGGRFRFDDVKEGDYAARYQSPDYWLTAGPSDYRVFHVAAGSPVKLEARMMPWSRISGRVVDGRGKSVANARLELTGSGMTVGGRVYLRTSWGGGGGRQLGDSADEMSFMGTADAQGRFEVRVMPGSYGLSALPPENLKPPDAEQDGPSLAWKRTYYPGTAVAEAASKILVLPGGDVPDVELKLLAVPARTVRGVLLYPDGAPAAHVTINLGNGPRVTSVESGTDGAFDLPAVAEGEWQFSAETQRGGVKLRATEWIDVMGHDLENVKLRLVAPLRVRGRIIMDAPQGVAPPRPAPFILSRHGGRTQRDGGPLGLGEIALVEPDVNGNFSVDVYPGVYRFVRQLQPPPAPFYLDSARVGDADMTTREVEFLPGEVEMTVVYKAGGGSVQGVAENCLSGGVVLVPRDPLLRGHGLSRSGPCDASNRYEVRATRPGEYYAVAFAGNGPVLTVDETMLNQSAKVTVRDGETASVDLRASTRPVY